jgi:hypothetical protein
MAVLMMFVALLMPSDSPNPPDVAEQNVRPATAPPCQAPQFAQFDFWLGEWEVVNPKGVRAGTNSITRIHGGCVVAEAWQGAGGVTGSSFNMYTPSTRKWHQVWVDSSGMLLRLEGEFIGGAMRLQGTGLTPEGTTLNRVTWTPRPDGTVRQLWESSNDRGRSWQTVFDGMYRKIKR